jgi:hypothetical protein
MTDWRAWHEHYDDPASSLARRLDVVQRHLTDLVARRPPRRILSLCAGDGRDVIPVLAALARDERPELVLVELDHELATAGAARAAAEGVDATVVTGDAGASASWREWVPVDLLMLCGIFGNITVEDIRSTIAAIPAIVSDHGVVVWTRGARADVDLRPLIRQWLVASGLDEVAFEGEPQGYGVGVNERTAEATVNPLPEKLFAFLD